MSTEPHATIVILTKNGMPHIQSCLSMVFRQETPWPFEVLVIDSCSTDGTLEVVKTFPCRLMQIEPRAFNHGATRNLGAQHARGQFVVFLVQDAVPSNSQWLSTLVGAAEMDQAAGSYGRQVPHAHSHALTRRAMEKSYPCVVGRVIKRLPDADTYGNMKPIERFHLALFTDGCSCLRKDVWSRYPYAHVSYGEDIEWAQRVLEAGFAIVYEPAAVVYHSHDRSAWYEFKRAYADHHLVHQLFDLTMIPSLPKMLRTFAWSVKDSWAYLWRSGGPRSRKARLWLWAPLLSAAQVSGQYLGARAVRLDAPWFRHVDAMLRRDV